MYRKLRRVFLAVGIIALLGALAVPAMAQGNEPEIMSITLSERRINWFLTYRNPFPNTFTDLSVDLTPGKVTLYATIVAGEGSVTPAQEVPSVTETVLVPYVNCQRIFWSVESAMINGQPATQEQLDKINRLLVDAWQRLIENYSCLWRSPREQ
ncbi:MAG: hypothetical protein GYB66_09830 [Chloroflexi bacterium]|nr:hypothetical protein [Chloroflexota bacterium]